MVKIKKKEKAAVFKSVTGTNIALDILIKDRILKVTIFSSSYSIVMKRGIILMILTLCNILGLILDILNFKLVTAIFIIILLDFFKLFTMVKEENLVIINGLGTQVTTKYMSGEKTVFIPQEQVQNVFINEVIYRNRIIYILCLMTKDTTTGGKLIPLFFGTLPRIACLKVIYTHVKAVIQM